LVAVDEPEDVLGGHRDVHRCRAPVEGGRDLPAAAQPLGRALPDAVALLDGQLTHVHYSLLLGKWAYTKRVDTDSSSWIRRIASASSGATERTRVLGSWCSGVRGMVLVMTTSSSTDSRMRAIAGPDRTPCTAQARMRAAPSRLSASTAWIRVPAVSIMSSMITTSRPLTSPIRCMNRATLFPSRRLSMMARPALNRFALARARS